MEGGGGRGAEWKCLLERTHSLPESQPVFLIIVLLIYNSHAIKLIDLKSINMVKQ